MGFFEMSDLAGGDVGWRLRLGYNLVIHLFLYSIIYLFLYSIID